MDSAYRSEKCLIVIISICLPPVEISNAQAIFEENSELKIITLQNYKHIDISNS